jgi:hypothetical protein
MPENRTVLLCASGVIVAGLTAQLLAPRCAFEQAAAATSVADPTWGTIANLTIRPTKDGDLFEATSANGPHRILRTARVTKPGRYRISIETQLDATLDLGIQIGGAADQPYVAVVANLRTGKIESIKGSGVDAGSEPLGPGRFRWWVDQEYKPGQVGYVFSVLNVYDGDLFPGQGACRMILSNPGFHKVEE